MPEPITIGALVAAALAAGAAEAGKGLLGGLVKDAYASLKNVAASVLGDSVARLEEKPDSANRAGMIAELVDEQPESVRSELSRLADALRAALEQEGKGAALAAMRDQFNAYGGQQFNAPAGTQNFGKMPQGQ